MISKEFKKIPTGVEGIDKLLGGGIPEHSNVLVSGGPGCGKTTFLCQYINEGLKRGETCLYVTLEESVKQIKQDAIQFGWNFEEYEKKNKLYIKQYNPFEVSGNLGLNTFEHYVEYIKAKRIVMDPITLFAEYVSGEAVDDAKGRYAIRKEIFNVIERLKKLNVTTLMSGEVVEGDGKKLSKYGEEEFVVDGVIVMKLFDSLNTRKIQIVKMRGIKHTLKSFELEITDNGINVKL